MAYKNPSVDLDKLAETVLCYAENIYRFNGVWDGPDPMYPVIPLFLIQLTISIFTTRLFVLVLKPLNQPTFVGEILSGIFLGPSVLGQIPGFKKVLYPTYSFRFIEPLAHFALCYYAFLTGLQMDIKAMLQAGTKTVNVAIGGIIIPFGIGSGIYFMFKTPEYKFGFFFCGAALAATGFPVLRKLLEKKKLNHTEMGKTAMDVALISDMSSWIFLGLGLAVTNAAKSYFPTWTLLSVIMFVLFCIYYLRRALNWIIRRTSKSQGYSDFYVCVVLTGAGLCGVVTDAFGTHAIIGAFVYGLVIPNQVLEAALLDKLEEFVMGILMPAFYMVCGFRTNVHVVDSSWMVIGCAILLACSAKVLSTLVVSVFCNIPTSEAVAVGMLTNTKGIMVMIILEVAQTQYKILTTQGYTMMVVTTLLMTMIVPPMIRILCPSEDLMPYIRRTISRAKPDEELRILACLHTTRNIVPIINLLAASNPSIGSPISVFALHLRELIGRAFAGLVVHNSRRSRSSRDVHSDPQVDQIISTFDSYELRSEGVTTQTLSLRSAYSTMDEDICNVATDKRAAFILLPFHKLQNSDGDEEDINPAIQSVNEGVLACAPCSVGILIDRGRLSESHYDESRNVAMLYFGGPDDREALAYAWRMAGKPGIRLSVYRFTPGEDALDLEFMDFGDNGHVNVNIDTENEKMLDDEFLNKFNFTVDEDNNSISYTELVLNDEEEAVQAIKAMDNQHYDLFIVGKGRGMVSPLTVGLADWCDCPELGAIGDLLVTSEFETAFSVLVVQQYVSTFEEDLEGSARFAGSMSGTQGMDKQLSIAQSETFGSLTSFRVDYDDN